MKHTPAHRRGSSDPQPTQQPTQEYSPEDFITETEPSEEQEGFADSEPEQGSASSARLPWMWQSLGVIAEILITLAVVCGLYVVWQMWWTGVESEHAQEQMRQQVAWSDPNASKNLTIAQAQTGEPPVEPKDPSSGELIGQIYIPRFGSQWKRNIVEGTDLEELNLHGIGHYTQSQLPGELGNFAVAGHRNGYGQPLGDVDKLTVGDAIVVRTKDYWYVYKFTSDTIVLPTQVSVIAANPENPGQSPTKRMITLTTCEPKYTTATHRWISYGQLEYWAKVSDGIPKELSATDSSGKVQFINSGGSSVTAQLGSLTPIILGALVVYAILFIAAAIPWRWPALRRNRRHQANTASIYGTLLKLQPGIFGIRILLLAVLLFVVAAALFQWGFPWLAANIPYLRAMSNYVTV